MSTKKSYQKGPGLRDSLRKKEKNISARGGRISTGPANPTLDITTHQPLTQGSGTPSDVRPRTDKEFDKSILLLKDGAGNEASRSASPEGVTENASTIPEYGLNIKSSNDDVNKIEYCLCDARAGKHQGRGDNRNRKERWHSQSGSPPHAWGQSLHRVNQPTEYRFTPTCVGTICSIRRQT